MSNPSSPTDTDPFASFTPQAGTSPATGISPIAAASAAAAAVVASSLRSHKASGMGHPPPGSVTLVLPSDHHDSDDDDDERASASFGAFGARMMSIDVTSNEHGGSRVPSPDDGVSDEARGGESSAWAWGELMDDHRPSSTADAQHWTVLFSRAVARYRLENRSGVAGSPDANVSLSKGGGASSPKLGTSAMLGGSVVTPSARAGTPSSRGKAAGGGNSAVASPTTGGSKRSGGAKSSAMAAALLASGVQASKSAAAASLGPADPYALSVLPLWSAATAYARGGSVVPPGSAALVSLRPNVASAVWEASLIVLAGIDDRPSLAQWEAATVSAVAIHGGGRSGGGGPPLRIGTAVAAWDYLAANQRDNGSASTAASPSPSAASFAADTRSFSFGGASSLNRSMSSSGVGGGKSNVTANRTSSHVDGLYVFGGLNLATNANTALSKPAPPHHVSGDVWHLQPVYTGGGGDDGASAVTLSFKWSHLHVPHHPAASAPTVTPRPAVVARRHAAMAAAQVGSIGGQTFVSLFADAPTSGPSGFDPAMFGTPAPASPKKGGAKGKKAVKPPKSTTPAPKPAAAATRSPSREKPSRSSNSTAATASPPQPAAFGAGVSPNAPVLFVFGGCDGHGNAVSELMMLHTGLPQAGWRKVPTFGDVLDDDDEPQNDDDLPYEAAAPAPQPRSHHGMALSRPGGASEHPLLFVCGGATATGRVLHDLWYLPLRFDGMLPPRWQQVVVPPPEGAIPRGVGHVLPMVDAALRAGSCPPAHAAARCRTLGRTHGTLTVLPYLVAGVPAEPGNVPLVWAGGCAPADRPRSELPPAALLTVRIAKEDRKPLPTIASRHAGSSGFTPSRRGISFFNQNGAATAVEDTQPATAELVECCALRVAGTPRLAVVGGDNGGEGELDGAAPKPPVFHGLSTAPAVCPVILSEAFGLRAATLLWCGPDACRTPASTVADTADADAAPTANGGISADGGGAVEDAALFARRLGLSIHGVSLISA